MDIMREGEATILNAIAVLEDLVRDQLQTEELAGGSFGRPAPPDSVAIARP